MTERMVSFPTKAETLAAVDRSSRSPALRTAIQHLMAGRLEPAEQIVRNVLRTQPRDAAANCILADLAARAGIYPQAVNLLRQVLADHPAFTEARFNLAKILMRTRNICEALTELDTVVDHEPENGDAMLARLALLSQIGAYEDADHGYRALLDRHPGHPEAWIAYANLCKTLGRGEISIEAYRRSLALQPMQGEAWWGLANLKSYRFSPEEIEAMASLVTSRPDHPISSLVHFALGKAFEDVLAYERSFRHYQRANSLRRATAPYDAADMTTEVNRSISFFSKAFFAELPDTGTASRSPIFIVGMPRSGSTLVEQILASHPMVEGTSELPYIPMLVHELLADRWRERTIRFPAVIAALDVEQRRHLGQAYLDTASIHRRKDRPYFIDKLPNNWAYVGFIRSILPDSTIIDVRRNRASCCFSNFKQHYSSGQEFSYSQTDTATYYDDYVRLMEHFAAVLPGPPVRVDYETLVASPRTAIAALLSSIGLPFDEACLDFHSNDRPVRTASAQQVRRPLTNHSLDQWRHYAAWLDPGMLD